MTRKSKQARRRMISPRRPRQPSKKTGPKRAALEFGYRPHPNTAPAEMAMSRFIPKM